MARLFCFLLSALSLLWVLVVISPQVYRPLMLLIGVWATMRVKSTKGRYGPAIDTLWVVAALLGLGWPLANGDPFLYRATSPTGGDILCGVLAIAAVLEAARRTTGWILPISASLFLAYAFAGPTLASIGLGGIAHRGYDLPRLIGNLYMTLEGMFGLPLDVAVTYIVLFTVYGAVLEYSGAGRFFLDFSLAIASSRGANPAAAAGRSVTLAGFLLGTVSGSGVATTVTLGSVAWPILKRVGFAPETAGAMLASSGIGALLSPPTLGAAAFLIAEYLQISYLQVLVMATIPTLLYYLSIMLMIQGEHVSNAGQGFSPGAAAAVPRPRTPALAYLHFSSLAVVAVLMAIGLTPFRAVFWATLAAVALSFVANLGQQPRLTSPLAPAGDEFQPALPSIADDTGALTPRRLTRALTAGGEDVLPVLATTAVAGIIVGVVTLTGLGLRAAGLIVGLAGGSLPLTVIFAAAAVWILGLAVPVTASYIISAVMVVPALTEVGVAPVAAHMFIFYYAVLSEVSPPTALAPFAAAAITGGRPFRTMMLTWKYALPAFLVPFAFTLDPRGMGLLLQSGWGDVAMSSLTAAAGVAALAVALSGHAIRRATLVERVLAGTGGLCLFYAAPVADAVGLALTAAAVVSNWSRRRD
ncbi:MAG TPA: TRAP transporter fused permease subunit [Vicinamibacterales bacterium]|nr:TRAP transporter fused permease subunit [Vicinamibacterales bacterium]